VYQENNVLLLHEMFEHKSVPQADATKEKQEQVKLSTSWVAWRDHVHDADQRTFGVCPRPPPKNKNEIQTFGSPLEFPDVKWHKSLKYWSSWPVKWLAKQYQWPQPVPEWLQSWVGHSAVLSPGCVLGQQKLVGGSDAEDDQRTQKTRRAKAAAAAASSSSSSDTTHPGMWVC
jgi:hypothetical protein